jgi:hypothetical protein
MGWEATDVAARLSVDTSVYLDKSVYQFAARVILRTNDL